MRVLVGKLILSKKDYIKIKNEIICYVGSDDAFDILVLNG